ncbi:TrmH family RNA methyltransferase [Lentibacillus cibarius]|uniref:TrmH family RNA methyltransferase n=1 Tax=Lentibacillus cibarius TaxID=2583219 RepID=UPI002D770443|nr:RNA methyltransferase [Lentibacillus cibarius]
MVITSLQNEKVKKWMKLHKRKGRNQTGLFLAEGFHIVEEAYKSGWEIAEIIIAEETACPDWGRHLPIVTVSKKIMQHITQTETPQGIVATVNIKPSTEVLGNTVLLIDAVQDPGNLGTIIRTADAAGFSAVMLGEGTVDLYNDKVIRSTQGSLFHLPVVQTNLQEKIPELQKRGYTVWAAALQDADSYESLRVSEKQALIVGNEGSGIRDEIIHLVDQSVSIPIYGKAESLNVSVAAGILMYYIKS